MCFSTKLKKNHLIQEKTPLYNLITDGMIINPKNKEPYYIPFDESPRIAISSNKMLKNTDASTNARIAYDVLSSWYHRASSGENADYCFLDDHDPIDDFGKDLIFDYTPEDWNRDLAFICGCIQYFMIVSAKNIHQDTPQRLLNEVRNTSLYSPAFGEWAMEHFTDDKMGIYIELSDLRSDYNAYDNNNNLTTHQFKTSLRCWLNVHGYVFNADAPDGLKPDGRIIRYSAKKQQAVEFVFITRRS